MPRVDLPDSHHRRASSASLPGPAKLQGREPSAETTSPPASTRSRPASGVKPGALRRLTFVTGNAGKLAEMSALLAPLGIEVVQDGRGYPEMQTASLGAVTEAGARHLLAAGLAPPFILEDSGLFVAALRGFPGVYSRNALDTIGCAGLLRLLQDVELEMRSATFQTDLAYVDGTGAVHHFEGACKGRIAERAAGAGGFGFDPIFSPHGQAATFAQMDAAQKGTFSHRGKAVAAFARHLSEAANP